MPPSSCADIDIPSATNAAIEAALRAGEIIWNCYQVRHATTAAAQVQPGFSAAQAASLGVETKDSATDLVTRYDKMCDMTVTRILRRYSEVAQRQQPSMQPFHFITEELSPDAPLTDAPTWIVDPIDGTMSFVHGMPDCAVSIGLAVNKEPVIAVVFCPFVMSSSGVSLRELLAGVDAVAVPWADARLQSAVSVATGGSPTSTGAGPMPGGSPGTSHLNLTAPSNAVSTPMRVGSPGESTPPPSPPPPASSGHTPPPRPLFTRPGHSVTSPTRDAASSSGGRSPAQSCVSAGTSVGHPGAAAAAAVGTGAAALGNGLPECYGELLVAIKGEGCFLNGTRVHVQSHTETMDKALVVFNMPYNVKRTEAEKAADDSLLAADPEGNKRKTVIHTRRCEAIDATMRIHRRLLVGMCPSVRMYGSCVVTMAMMAAGRLGGMVEPAGKAWDVCAGTLLVTEAGGVVYNLYGEKFDMTRDTTVVLACSEAVAAALCEQCRRERFGQYWLLPDAKPENVVVGKKPAGGEPGSTLMKQTTNVYGNEA